MNNSKNCWTVYEHITPSGKRYIGITSTTVKKRWSNGRGYRKNTPFGKAIEKYKWDNIQHNIVSTDFTEKEAKWLENYLICYYRTFVGFKDSKGYNCTLGGDGQVGFCHTPWNKGKTGVQVAWNKGKTGVQVAWNKGKKCKPLTDETKRKQSASLKGKTKGRTSPTKGKHWKLIDGKRHYE